MLLNGCSKTSIKIKCKKDGIKMHHELPAMERQAMRNRIDELENMFKNMQSDFAKCAKDNISPCFFCANDETCSGCPKTCNFVWNKHI
jgi:hypothetical protein